ncbi:hypothetical protein UA70_18030 [Raoultella planticola]|nr:hypothetical protein UA70_18030 [Raoultella planticola]
MTMKSWFYLALASWVNPMSKNLLKAGLLAGGCRSWNGARTFVAVGSDLGVFRSATQKLADSFKK